MPASTETLAYLAGLFDGEGTFCIQVSVRDALSAKPSVLIHPRMSMTLKFGNEVLDDLATALGGRCYVRPDVATRVWSLSRRDHALSAARTLAPFLRVKRRVCERFIEALEIMPSVRKVHRRGERTWTAEMAVRVAEIAFTLNPGGKLSEQKRTTEFRLAALRRAFE